MSAADRLAAEHGGWFNLDGVWRCNCGEPLPSSANADMWMRAHIAAVTEAAVREQVAREIEVLTNLLETERRAKGRSFDQTAAVVCAALEEATGIARGDIPCTDCGRRDGGCDRTQEPRT